MPSRPPGAKAMSSRRFPVRAEVARRGLEIEVDSAGTSDWHIGKAPDPRAQAVALRNGVDISSYGARQVCAADFTRFAHIIALDTNNYADLEALRPDDATAELSLLLDHVPGRAGQPVADPYYGDDAGFDITWAEVTEGAKGLAELISR